ncbi:MAG: response regulator [[Ruminococcus] gnavus]|nr:response regulator [Mediterraneibacter gnavus]
MSIKLLIADDEYFIRQRIKKIVPWEKLGLTFSGEAENGAQVIEQLEKEPSDILLLDIKMPQMNGIETAKYIKEHFPSVHIIILSGYNDFEYAQTAMRYGVKEYLLKPVANEELERALKECMESIAVESQTRHSLKHYEHFQLCNILAGIRDGALSYQDLCVQYPDFEQFSYSIYCSVYIAEHTTTAIMKLIERFQNQGVTCEYLQESEYIYILQLFLSDKDCLLHLGSCFTEFIANEPEYVFLYVENIFSVTDDWKPHYTRCLHLLTERYFSADSNLCISYSHPDRPGFQEELLKMRKHFITVLNTQNSDTLQDYLDRLFLSIQQKKNCDYLTLVIHEIFVVYHVYFHIPENLAQPIPEFAATIMDAEHSLENLKNEILFYGLQCIKKIDAIPSDIALCGKIIEYIQKHYTDPSLSVSQVAEIFQLHPSYLGSVFKKVQHTSVLQYISDLRISTAQKLLKEGTMKISEIADAAGYSDVYYFSKKFKKACGCSPKEYAAKSR